MLDVHILILESRPEDIATRCVESVLYAAGCAGFPVDVHVLKGIDGHIGQGRAKGYTLGNHPYVTYVDDDDYVLPFAFEQMREALERGVSAIFTPEMQEQNGRMSSGPKRHHLIAYRRDMLIDHTAFVVCGDLAQMRHAEKSGDVVDLECPAYVHRLYESGGRILRRKHHDELRMARA